MTPSTLLHSDEVISETPREALLNLLGLADASPEDEFDEIVELATAICGKPLGAMSLLTDTENFTKATVGLPAARVPMKESVCRFTVLQDDVMMVEDTHADHRFDEHGPMIHSEGGIRFYAGMPLVTVDGTRIGSLCVMDTAPSTLTRQQIRALKVLGRQISSRLQLRERAATVAKMATELERTHVMFDTILNNVPVEIYLKDKTGRILFYNQKLADRFNVSPVEWIGKTSYDLWNKQTAEEIVREDEYVLRSGKLQESFVEIPEPNGTVSYWRSMKVACQIPPDTKLLACCSVDMTEHMVRERKLQEIQDALEEANRKLNSLALTDELTGLWNRRAFNAQVETFVMGSHRSKQPMALMLLDVDDFKNVNDRYGHPYGDVVLQHVASVLQRVKRAEDIACRFGGEEFAILLPGTPMEGAQRLAQRILDAMHAFPWEKECITVSMGLAMCKAQCTSDDLVDAADAALYSAKHAGKDRMMCEGCER
ncbi:diguanylate cyclase (GGDEF) domain-containing protein [Terriglobus roseus DSM 18391]|uniref:diguanylate cyclase n=1 Tax=Terriglobus roseus (strain DSM 18391 / NRRL B-41598 / KBS 63) TaxID=926566 RepID=I3ZLX8_TERRK|nr:diguanylate cyclase [Terriglobus roseus]AFL90246.1 diguanylate cyclase (GGDEF) domain-containing protein [Terriglobus roseus DSM 18391]